MTSPISDDKQPGTEPLSGGVVDPSPAGQINLGDPIRTFTRISDVLSEGQEVVLSDGTHATFSAGNPAGQELREKVAIVEEWLRMVAVCTLEGGIIRRPPISQTEIDAIRAILSALQSREGR